MQWDRWTGGYGTETLCTALILSGLIMFVGFERREGGSVWLNEVGEWRLFVSLCCL